MAKEWSDKLALIPSPGWINGTPEGVEKYHSLVRDYKRLIAPLGRKPRPEYDHIIPFSKGGGTVVENMHTLCSGCHAKVTAEFARKRALERKKARESAQQLISL